MYVKIDLAYKVAYLLDDNGVDRNVQSGVTRSSADDVVASWGYAYAPASAWQVTDILNAVDAVQRAVEPLGA